MPLLYWNSIDKGHTLLGIFESKEDYLKTQNFYEKEDWDIAPVYTREEVVEDLLNTIHHTLKNQIGIISTPYTTTQSRKAIEIIYRTKIFVLSDEGGDHLLLKQEMTEERRKSKFWKNIKRFDITGDLQNWCQKAGQIVELITK